MRTMTSFEREIKNANAKPYILFKYSRKKHDGSCNSIKYIPWPFYEYVKRKGLGLQQDLVT